MSLSRIVAVLVLHTLIWMLKNSAGLLSKQFFMCPICLDPDQTWRFVLPDLGPNCLLKTPAGRGLIYLYIHLVIMFCNVMWELGLEVIKRFSCSTQLSMGFIVLNYFAFSHYLLWAGWIQPLRDLKQEKSLFFTILSVIINWNFMLSSVENEREFYNLEARRRSLVRAFYPLGLYTR